MNQERNSSGESMVCGCQMRKKPRNKKAGPEN